MRLGSLSRRSPIILVAIACGLVPSAMVAQSDANVQADAEAMLQVVDDLFDAMRAKDAETLERIFHPNTRLITADLVQAQRAMMDGSALIFLAGGNYLTSGLRKQGAMNVISFVPEPIEKCAVCAASPSRTRLP